MKIAKVRARVLEWQGGIVPPRRNFCTNAMDLLYDKGGSMSSFCFQGRLAVEVETAAGQIEIGNAALAPRAAEDELSGFCINE